MDEKILEEGEIKKPNDKRKMLIFTTQSNSLHLKNSECDSGGEQSGENGNES